MNEMSFDLTFYTKTLSTPKSESFDVRSLTVGKSERTHSRRIERFRNFPLVSGGQFFVVPLWLGSTTGVYRGRRAGWTEKKKPYSR